MLKLTTAKYYIPSGRCIQAIDYSHSQEGTVRSVPDSLISEYTTRAGRKVYDGGGIMPDIRTEPEYISRFAMTLYALGFIEDFGDEYVRRHPGQQIDIRTFSITDGDYAEFAEFMKDKEVPYESDTRRALKKLREAAKTDRFEEVEQQIAAIDSTLRDDTATNLETYRKEIVDRFAEMAGNRDYLRDMHRALVTGNAEVLESELERVLANSASFFDLVRENSYHMLMLGLLFGVPGYANPLSNREAGDGRPDIVVNPERPDSPVIVVEVKHAKDADKKTLEALAAEALVQIADRGYIDAGVPSVRWGVAFSGKHARAVAEMRN